MKKYVIVGNGTAAVGAVEGIRSADKESEIVIVSEERHHVYCRPLISYYLEGKTDARRMKYRPDDFYDRNGCRVLYGVKAVKLDAENKSVLLDDGSQLKYDKLCAATGSSAFVPRFDGLDTVEEKHTFMTMDDMLGLEKAVRPDSRVLIVGAGLIGLKCAEGLAHRVAEITVCDLADRVLSSVLDGECAEVMQRHLEKNGIRFMLSDTAQSFEGKTALMKSGKTVGFDILVLAVGVRPNVSIVADAGGKCGKGITVDARSQTSLTDVYAAGDCAECMDISCGGVKVLAILPNAYMQGRCAGINMAGGEEEFDMAIPMNSVGFFGLHAMTAGSMFDESNGGEVYRERTGNGIKKLFSRDGRLTGFILIGDVDRAGIYTNMIRKRIPLSEVDYEDLKKIPNLFAFGKKYRDKILGGVV